MQKHAHQRHAGALASGKHANALVYVIPPEQETAKQIPDHGRRFPRGGSFHAFQNRFIRIQIISMRLGEKSYLRMASHGHAAGTGGLSAGNKAGKCGFPRPVYSYNGNAVSLDNFKIHILKNGNGTIMFGNLFQPDHRMGASGRSRKVKVHDGVILFHLNQFHFFQLLDAGLHQGSLGGFITETVDKFLRFGNLPVLSLFLAQQNFLPQHAFFQKIGKIARVFLRPAVVKSNRTGNQSIQKRHIMGNKDDSAPVGAQILFHPPLGLDVQMVGRFVQKQHFRLPEQQFG